MSIVLKYPRVTFEANGTMTVEGPDVQVTVEKVGDIQNITIGPPPVEQVHNITISPSVNVDSEREELARLAAKAIERNKHMKTPAFNDNDMNAVQAAYAYFASDDKVAKPFKRVTINAPKPEDALHFYHGQRGLATNYVGGTSVFYFLMGEQVSVVVKTRSLVEGWIDV